MFKKLCRTCTIHSRSIARKHAHVVSSRSYPTNGHLVTADEPNEVPFPPGRRLPPTCCENFISSSTRFDAWLTRKKSVIELRARQLLPELPAPPSTYKTGGAITMVTTSPSPVDQPTRRAKGPPSRPYLTNRPETEAEKARKPVSPPSTPAEPLTRRAKRAGRAPAHPVSGATSRGNHGQQRQRSTNPQNRQNPNDQHNGDDPNSHCYICGPGAGHWTASCPIRLRSSR
ncbi:hypothetical protein DFS34DRAFT_467281 [Phlyctochytrium arcticum]|nr:hypothetical protein DFS34DRAFT_467281 [Phlyctochytrium arcticum]